MDIKIKEKAVINQLITAEQQISALEQAAENKNMLSLYYNSNFNSHNQVTNRLKPLAN